MSADDTQPPSFTDEAVRNTFTSLSPESCAIMVELEARAQEWTNATDRARYLAVAYGVPIEVAARIDREMTEAMGRKLDHAVFHGAPEVPIVTPEEVHVRLLGHDGAHPRTTPTQEEGTGGPEVPQNENGSQADPGPVMRRDAWITLHRALVHDMERQLAAHRDRLRFVPRFEGDQVIYLAGEWAALQLLKALRDMKAPEVPVDDRLGQATLEEALEDDGPLGRA